MNTHIVVSNALLAICNLPADPISALVYSQNAVEQSNVSDPEQYRSILIVLEEICRLEAGEPSQHVIDDQFENNLQKLPVPRRIEGWLFLAQYWARAENPEKQWRWPKRPTKWPHAERCSPMPSDHEKFFLPLEKPTPPTKSTSSSRTSVPACLSRCQSSKRSMPCIFMALGFHFEREHQPSDDTHTPFSWSP